MQDHWSWEGVHLVWIVLGLIGAALGIGSMPPMTKRECWVALGSGLVFAALGPLWVNHAAVHWAPRWLTGGEPLPMFMLGTAAFICGIGGMFLIPTIIAFWRDPRAFLVSVLETIRMVKREGK